MTNIKRVTLEDIEKSIRDEHYFTGGQGLLGANIGKVYTPPLPLELITFCVLTLDNGFTVVGKSACADPGAFDADIGRQLARNDAIRQVWSYLGFRLRDAMAAEQLTQTA